MITVKAARKLGGKELEGLDCPQYWIKVKINVSLVGTISASYLHFWNKHGQIQPLIWGSEWKSVNIFNISKHTYTA